MKLFGPLFRTTFIFVFFAELLSLCAHLVPDFNAVCFFVVLILTLFLTLVKIEYGLGILFAELFIGSKGYLFYLDYDGIMVSIRIALWLIIMSVWLGDFITKQLKKKGYSLMPIFKTEYFKYFFILFIFVGWGFLNGYLKHNDFNNLFFDFNGWIFFTLIFPVYSVIKNEYVEENTAPVTLILQVFTAAITWLSLETLFLLFVFSHNITSITTGLYQWIRVTGVGEITRMDYGFYRIFFQSHIFILVGFFIFFLLLVKELSEKKENQNKKKNLFLFSFLVLYLTVTLVSFSRSNWVGLASGGLIASMIIIYLFKWKKFLVSLGVAALALFFSIGLIFLVVRFPYPESKADFSASLLADRAMQINSEAAASSRWALLPVLWDHISDAPMFGRGFGTTVTYKTEDPRALEATNGENFTTYAFEWGWLDIWLKLGIFGLLSYIFLLFAVILKSAQTSKDALSELKIIETGLLIGLTAIMVINFFSPYLNHPLGIGYLILVSSITTKNNV